MDIKPLDSDSTAPPSPALGCSTKEHRSCTQIRIPIHPADPATTLGNRLANHHPHRISSTQSSTRGLQHTSEHRSQIQFPAGSGRMRGLGVSLHDLTRAS
jgi:hypothetical protein